VEGEMKSDLVGLLLTAACIVHCLVLPVALLAAPVWSAWLGETENVLHWLLFFFALLVSGYALLIGFRRHRAVVVVWVGAVGLLVMLAAAAHLFGRTTEAALTMTGAVIVAAAHVLNLRLHTACAHG
jgi:O-antigen/teichoic acid export membrane protein